MLYFVCEVTTNERAGVDAQVIERPRAGSVASGGSSAAVVFKKNPNLNLVQAGAQRTGASPPLGQPPASAGTARKHEIGVSSQPVGGCSNYVCVSLPPHDANAALGGSDLAPSDSTVFLPLSR
jgi:hypothetical protein